MQHTKNLHRCKMTPGWVNTWSRQLHALALPVGLCSLQRRIHFSSVHGANSIEMTGLRNAKTGGALEQAVKTTLGRTATMTSAEFMQDVLSVLARTVASVASGTHAEPGLKKDSLPQR